MKKKTVVDLSMLILIRSVLFLCKDTPIMLVVLQD